MSKLPRCSKPYFRLGPTSPLGAAERRVTFRADFGQVGAPERNDDIERLAQTSGLAVDHLRRAQ